MIHESCAHRAPARSADSSAEEAPLPTVLGICITLVGGLKSVSALSFLDLMSFVS